MESSSSSRMAINGGIIKFKNQKCSCGIKAAVKISESQNNPKKLYFFCERGKCNFYKFWDPDNEEFNQTEFLGNNSQRYDGSENFQVQQEMTSVMQKLELLWQMVQHLESLHSLFNQDVLVVVLLSSISGPFESGLAVAVKMTLELWIVVGLVDVKMRFH
ncbi:hypothetical protein Q3G72_026277 [Acer saccharum]|nr:hypothetical protein Q3G72_026277 [Acer saccharum]